MNLDLSEEQLAIQQGVREFARDVVAPRAKEIDETKEWPHDIVKGCAEMGLMGISVPEEFGGDRKSTRLNSSHG